jgi:hypothetical protein
MLVIDQLADTIYQCVDEEDMREFTVALLDDRLMLYGNIGDQEFTYEGEDLSQEALKRIFPDGTAARRLALKHTRGILNKKKVAENAKKLGEAGVIALMASEKLSEMVSSCNCAPVKFIERLLTNGFDLDVINKLGIYEKSSVYIS